MSYTPTTWTTGDIITAAKANNWENGIVNVTAGGISIASQAALDFIYASSATQLGRLAKGSALQSVRLNAAGTAYEFFTPSTGNKDICNGRLTLESGVPSSVTDQSAKGTLYFTPYKGNQIGLYAASQWTVLTFSEISLSLSGLTASRPYDIWAYNNSGTVALDKTAWSSATSPATAIAFQDNIAVKSGDATRRYLGTIYINASGNDADDTHKSAGVYNYYNRLPRPLYVIDTSNGSWTYGAGSWRYSNNNSGNQVSVVCSSIPDDEIFVIATGAWQTDTNNAGAGATGIGIDSSTVNSATTSQYTHAASSFFIQHQMAMLRAPNLAGRRTYRWLEYGNDGGTCTMTWYDTASLAAGLMQTGMVVTMFR